MSIADPRAAARSALAVYLKTLLPENVTVLKQWPEARKPIVGPTVSILSSDRVQSEYHSPRVWSTTPTTGVNATVLYSYGRAEINMQLDCWESYPAKRDVLAALLETHLNRDPRETVDPDPPRVLRLRRQPGLVLRLTDYYSVMCEFIFEQPPGLNEGGRNLQTTSISPSVVGDWRATFTGRAIMHLMDRDTVAMMQTVTMKLGINGAAPETVPIIP